MRCTRTNTRATANGRSPSARGWLTAGIALILTAFIVSMAGTVLERHRFEKVQDSLRSQLRPAQGALEDLSKAYVEQETGQRGFMLTGDEQFLAPYNTGQAAVVALQPKLAAALAGDPTSLAMLNAINTAGTAWHNTSAQPEIDRRRQGPIGPAEVIKLALVGKHLFDALRSQLAVLADRLSGLVTVALERFDDEQSTADAAALAALVFGILAALSSVLALEGMLLRPLRRLVREIRAVADGTRQEAISVAGPREIGVIADAVNSMRGAVVKHGAELAVAESQLAVAGERERMATDLHHRTVQGVYGLGLSMSSLSGRSPELSAGLDPLIAETDRIIHELRGVIYPIVPQEGAGQT